MSTTFDKIISLIRSHFERPEEFVPLHEPCFVGNERKYVIDAIDSTFVSSVGRYVNEFERMMVDYTGASYAIATANGTLALHMAMLVAGVKQNDLVITQPLSFIATCNAISYLGASPLFIDVDRSTLGLSPAVLKDFLNSQCLVKGGDCFHKRSGRRIAACVPMHTFGHPVKLAELVEVCDEFKIPLVEDAAESIGSKYQGKHTGTFGLLGTFSLNGNKTITSGGGGVIVTSDEKLGKLAKHLTTQAKIPHTWNFEHDAIGYNYRLPNLNAAMACAQMEMLDEFIVSKRKLAAKYKALFDDLGIEFVEEPVDTFSNYWLSAILLRDQAERDSFLEYTNSRKVMTRPAWFLMTDLKMFADCFRSEIGVAQNIFKRLVNIPSSAKP